MISKIIQKEKDRQVVRNFYLDEEDRIKHMEFKEFHKQSLINLKEYIEEERQLFIKTSLFQFAHSKKEDIEELTEMIGRYG